MVIFTKHNRCTKLSILDIQKKRQHKELQSILFKGTMVMLKNNQLHSATELALLLLDHYKDNKVPLDSEIIENIIQIATRYPADNDQNARRKFIKTAINWTSSPDNNDQGDLRLHNAFAKIYHSEKDYETAERHYLRGSDTIAFCEMILESTTTPTELDIVIAKAVLQYLCLSNLKDANLLFNFFTERIPNNNLILFLKLLLKTLQRDALNLLRYLRKNFAKELEKDPTFNQYLDIIEKIYYGVETNQGLGGIISTLMKSFMGE